MPAARRRPFYRTGAGTPTRLVNQPRGPFVHGKCYLSTSIKVHSCWLVLTSNVAGNEFGVAGEQCGVGGGETGVAGAEAGVVRVQSGVVGFQAEDPGDAGQVDAVVDQDADAAESGDVGVAVAAGAAGGAGGCEESFAFVEAQRLGAHAGQLRGDGDA